jgi:hypothetical protein
MFGSSLQMNYLANPSGVGGDYWMGYLTSTFSPTGITVDASGNAILVGDDTGSPAKAHIMKISSAGAITWQKNFTNGTNGYSYYQCASDASDNIYVTGRVNLNNGDIVIVKHSNTGSISWQRQYSYSNATARDDYGKDIKIAANGSIFVGGYSIYSNVNYPLTLKYNSSGTLQTGSSSGSTFDQSTQMVASTIATDSSSNVFLAGQEYQSGNYYTRIVKRSSTGTLDWRTSILTALEPTRIVVDSSDNIYVVGGTTLPYIAKISGSAGTIIWQKEFTGTSGNKFYDVAIDSDDNIYAVGIRTEGSATRLLIVKFDTSGNITWQRKISRLTSGTAYNIGSEPKIAVDANDNMYILSPGSEKMIFKLPTDGSKTGTYSTPSYDYAYATSSYSTTTPTHGTEVLTSITQSAITTGSTTTTHSLGTDSYTNTLVDIPS